MPSSGLLTWEMLPAGQLPQHIQSGVQRARVQSPGGQGAFCQRDAGLRDGSLSIGLTRVRARTILPRILPSYSKRCPDVEVHIIIADHHGLQTKLLSGELDLVICNHPPVDENITHIPLFQNKFCVVVPKEVMLNKYGGKLRRSDLPHQQ